MDVDTNCQKLLLKVVLKEPHPFEYEFKLADTEGKSVPATSVGEIWVRGDCVFLGYYNDPVATKETIDSNGWLNTGDLAVSDDKGNIRLVGRAKEMFKSGGYNVYPREIEVVLEEHPGVALSAVIPAPDPLFQEVGWAFVIPKVAMMSPSLTILPT